jgi:sugar/nucleoside kinase (ribokinase family)
MIIVNFISGRDIKLPTLEKVRHDYKKPIYMDVHSLTLGMRSDGSRYLRRPQNWKRYTSCADFLQMNNIEFELLSGEEANKNTVKDFYKMHDPGILKALLITLGERGAYLTTRSGRGIRSDSIATPRTGRVLDSTGCGDVFGAGFCAARMLGFSIQKAAEIAVAAATLKTRTRGIENLSLPPLKTD